MNMSVIANDDKGFREMFTPSEVLNFIQFSFSSPVKLIYKRL